jgi:hypothetical protein
LYNAGGGDLAFTYDLSSLIGMCLHTIILSCFVAIIVILCMLFLFYIIAKDPLKPYYKISDMYTHKNQEFDYYFNFCQAIKADTPGLPEPCQEATGGTIPGNIYYFIF